MLTRAPLRIRAQGGRAGGGRCPHFGSGPSVMRIRARMVFVSLWRVVRGPGWARSACRTP